MDENDQRDSRVWVTPRTEFLRAVHRVAPHIIHEMHDIYTTLDGAARHQALREWGIRSHLTAAWCVQEVVNEFIDNWQLLIDHTWPVEAFTFSHPGANPKWTSKAAAKKEVLAACRKAFDLYWGAMENDLRQDDWLDPKLQYKREHYTWAARFQVLEESAQTIADDPQMTGQADLRGKSLSEQRVTAGVKSILRTIGLPMREHKTTGPKPKKRITQNAT